MHMRVEIEPSRMRVQHRYCTRATCQLPVVLAERAQCVPGAVHQSGVEQALMLPNQRAQLGGQGERDQEVAPRHQCLGLTLNPALALKVLAVRAIAVATGMRHYGLLTAVATLGQHGWTQAGAAVLHGIQGLALTGQRAGAVLRQVIGSKAFDDAGQRNHLTLPQFRVKRLINASMRALACSLVWLVRWV